MEKFVDLEEACPEIILDIRYATTNNFTGVQVYDSPKCFLRETVADKLIAIQKKLTRENLNLKVFDGYRPLSVQKAFWDFLPDDRYIGNPAIGSKHNRGAAVDVTLVYADTQEELIMPTAFDSFDEKAHSDCLDLPQIAIENRSKLQNAMTEGGFLILPTEWWHFDVVNWEDYPVEDLSFVEILDSCLATH